MRSVTDMRFCTCLLTRNRYDGTRVGICYSGNVRNRLRHGRYDCAVELLVTERYIRRINLIEKG